jgi:alanine dehydrogenase
VSQPPLWISEADVAELLTIDDALRALRRTFARDPANSVTMRRGHARLGESILHAVGGISATDQVAGTKTWLYTPRGASPLTILYGLEGRLLAVIEAFRLGQWRTAATTALATDVLARADADRLAVIGTGRQALSQVIAVAGVRELARVSVWGRDPARTARFAATVSEALGVEAATTVDVGAALSGAGIVVTVSRAAEPLVDAAHLTPGMHLNAVGAIVPTRSELTPAAVGCFDVVVADSPEQARSDSGELTAAAESGLISWERVRSLQEILDRPELGRRSEQQLTLFKSMGVGMSDVALAAAVLGEARRRGVGTVLPATPSPHSQDSNSEVSSVRVP